MDVGKKEGSVGTELTLHTGAQGHHDLIHLQWFDQNNVPQHTLVEFVILEQDKPRTLEIRVDGVTVATIVGKGA